MSRRQDAIPVVWRDVRRVADGFAFLEGPRWHDGGLYVSDFYTHRVLRIDDHGRVAEICSAPGQPSGLGFTPDGALLVVSMIDRCVLRADGGRTRKVADLSDIAPFHCNDMLVDAQGRAYVGNFGWDLYSEPQVRATHLILLQPDGSARPVAGDLVFPNGMALTPNGRTLLVAESFAARISAFDVASDGSLSRRRTWASFADRPFDTIAEALESGVVVPDGIALDAEGALWIADVNRRGPIRVAEGGRILEWCDTGELSVYAVALGDADRRTLYMCAAPPLLTHDPVADRLGRLLACRVHVPGAGVP